MAAKGIAVKKYVVCLSADERAQLNDLIHKGKRSYLNFSSAIDNAGPNIDSPGDGLSDMYFFRG